MAISSVALLAASVLTNSSWKTDCVVFGKHAYIATATFRDDHLNIVMDLFEHHGCDRRSLTGVYTGDISIGETTEIGTALTHHPLSSSFTLFLTDVVDIWNDPKLTTGCGFKDWRVNETRDVTGQYCFPYTVPEAGQSVADLVAIQGDVLRFGRSPAIVGGDLKTAPSALSPIEYRRIR